MVNYYNRYPGDYAKKTQDLSLAEHGAYALLLDYLYGTQQVLPKNPVGLYRVCKAFTEDEKAAVDSVIARFFIEQNDGYTNERYLEEVNRAQARIGAARENGKRGGRGQKKTQQEPSGFILGCPAGSNPLTQQEPSGSALHQPSAISKEKNESTFVDSPDDQKKNGKVKPSFDFERGRFIDLGTPQLEVWRTAYPAVQIETEINKAAAWLISNPKNRKSDYRRFLNGWLSRAQDSAPRAQSVTTPQQPRLKDFPQ